MFNGRIQTNPSKTMVLEGKSMKKSRKFMVSQKNMSSNSKPIDGKQHTASLMHLETFDICKSTWLWNFTGDNDRFFMIFCVFRACIANQQKSFENQGNRMRQLRYGKSWKIDPCRRKNSIIMHFCKNQMLLNTSEKPCVASHDLVLSQKHSNK